MSDWEAATLTRTQLEYAAQDALVALQIFQRLVAAGGGTQIACFSSGGRYSNYCFASTKVQILTQLLFFLLRSANLRMRLVVLRRKSNTAPTRRPHL